MSEAKQSKEDILEQIVEDFKLFDINGDGVISASELAAKLQKCGENIPDKELKAMIAEVDPEGKGVIRFPQFEKLMRSREEDSLVHQKFLLATLREEDEAENKRLMEEAEAAAEVKDDVVPDDKVLVGPIVGKVTTTTARILLETAGDCELVFTLVRTEKTGDKHTWRFTKKFRGQLPGVIVFSDLEPETVYGVVVHGEVNEKEERIANFRTSPTDPQKMNVVLACCDNGVGRRGTGSMYDLLYDKYLAQQKVDLMVHNGDQVYADLAFAQGKKILKEKDLTDLEKDYKILECYKRIYRKTFDAPDKRRVLSNVANLMLWDDHELRNDWGTFAQDTDPSSVDYRIASLARKAYWQYERQLWDDIPPVLLLPETEETKRRPTAGLKIMDVKITVKEAKGLASSDVDGKADPYFVLSGLDQSGKVIYQEKSKVCSSTLSPKFNHTAFAITDANEKQKFLSKVAAIRINLWDHDAFGKDDFLGEIILPIGRTGGLETNKLYSQWYPLHMSTASNLRDEVVQKGGAVLLEVDIKSGVDKQESDEAKKLAQACSAFADLECSFHVWGQFGVMIIDSRGSRSFGWRVGDRRAFLSSAQWQKIEEAMSPQGLFKDVRALICVHSMPVVMMSRTKSSTMSNLPPQVDKMGFGLFPEEQYEYLSLLSTWKKAARGRELLLAGGDLHFGVVTTIYDEGARLCQQIVSSAISNNAPPKPVYWLLRRMMRGTGKVGLPQRFRYDHQEFLPVRNFGLVSMSVEKEASIVTELVAQKKVVDPEDE